MPQERTEKAHFSSQGNPPRKGFPKMTSDLIAVGIFALGIGAAVGVGYLAYVKFTGKAEAPPATEGIRSEIAAAMKFEIPDCPGCVMPQPKAGEALPPERKLAVPDEKEMAGRWEYDYGTGTAYLDIRDGAFQLVAAHGRERRARQYARGSYEYNAETGLLTLYPRRDLGEPPAEPGVHYEVLTLRVHSVRVYREKNGEDLFWAPYEPGLVQGERHPIFANTGAGSGAIRWQVGG